MVRSLKLTLVDEGGHDPETAPGDSVQMITLPPPPCRVDHIEYSSQPGSVVRVIKVAHVVLSAVFSSEARIPNREMKLPQSDENFTTH
jgi:hypothetical protein